jgi:import inner membrane translocase subunit TIM21
MNSLITTKSMLNCPASIRPLLAARFYATQTGLGTTGSPRPRRKAVTAFNDDGRVAWGDLTAREKAARTAQQSFNFSFIIIGAILTVCLP